MLENGMVLSIEGLDIISMFVFVLFEEVLDVEDDGYFVVE